jgi:hypothetical protein
MKNKSIIALAFVAAAILTTSTAFAESQGLPQTITNLESQFAGFTDFLSTLENRVTALESIFVVNGTDGSDGAPGPAGPQGIDGLIGPQGIQGEPGVGTYTVSIDTSILEWTNSNSLRSVQNTVTPNCAFGDIATNAYLVNSIAQLDGTGTVFVEEMRIVSGDISSLQRALDGNHDIGHFTFTSEFSIGSNAATFDAVWQTLNIECVSP